MKKYTKKIIPGLAVVALSVTIVLIVPAGCSQPENATRVLKEQGYTNIEITGWRPFMKGKDDTFSTGFRATSPSGAIVTGAVTSGIFKGSTIRID